MRSFFEKLKREMIFSIHIEICIEINKKNVFKIFPFINKKSTEL